MPVVARFLKNLFGHRPTKPRPVLQVEALEDRIALNNRFVVPVAVIPDNVSAFTTLKAALTTPGLAAGDTVQIQLGAAPGNITNADIPALANLTIQGDPAAGPSEIPSFGINDTVTIDGARVNFTLRNAQAILQGGGLVFNANGTVVRSALTNNFAGTAVTLNAISQGVIQDSVIVANDGVNAGEVVRVNIIAGSQNLISGNTIVSHAPVNHSLVRYFGPNAIGDQVIHNTFIGNPGFGGRPLFITDALGSNGLTVRGNTFRDSDDGQVAIASGIGTQNLALLDNTITLTGATGTVGINVVGGGINPATALIANNRIDTSGNGVGIQFLWSIAFGTFAARIEGNDLHFNRIGVLVAGNLDGSVADIDLGGGSQGSLGANNFRGFTAAASPTQGAIVTSADAAFGPISAQMNLFSVPDPETVIFDQADMVANANVISSGNLTGNTAFVAALYLDLLGRRPQFSVPTDAIGWVNLLTNGASPLAVANGIARSTEALNRRAELLYRQFLHRDPDAPGKTLIVNHLQSGGALEPVSRGQLGSTEYQLLFGSDAAFVESLYTSLLRRNPSNAEVSAHVATLQQSNRFALADSFLHSGEYRGVEVRRFYAHKLNRLSLSSAEVDGWVNSSFDLFAIEILFAASPEFQVNG